MRLSDYVSQVTGFVPEAPVDGNQYARQDGNWSVVSAPDGGLPEAPTDGQSYVRQGSAGAWLPGLTAVEAGNLFAPAAHSHPYEPVFTKNTAFNKNFGTVAGTVSEGNHAHNNYAAVDHDHAGVYQPVGSYLTDAPSDGNQYARKNGGWEIVVSSGGGLEDAPSDGNRYGRQNGAWVTVAASSHAHSISNITGLQTALDGKASTSHTHSEYASSSHTHSEYEPIWSKNGSYINYPNRVGIKDTTPSYELDVSGTIRATANVIAYSDERLKEDVQPIQSALDKVRRLQGVSFIRNDMDDDRRHIGVIAQAIQPIVPEVVHEDDDGMLSVAYGPLVALLIEAIKELDAR